MSAFAFVQSATLQGVDGCRVLVEVHIDQGFPGFTVVGLPDAAVREARDRVRAALVSSGFGWPQNKITVNLAPSSIRKGGSSLDLAMAIAILVAADRLSPEVAHDISFLSELGLDGSLRRTTGTIPLVSVLDTTTVVVAPDAAAEAALVRKTNVRAPSSLVDLVDALAGRRPWPEIPDGNRRLSKPQESPGDRTGPDLATVRGQPFGRRVLEIAAAGGHHLLLSGPPGSGKTMLATCLPGLLPDLDPSAARVTSAVVVYATTA